MLPRVAHICIDFSNFLPFVKIFYFFVAYEIQSQCISQMDRKDSMCRWLSLFIDFVKAHYLEEKLLHFISDNKRMLTAQSKHF